MRIAACQITSGTDKTANLAEISRRVAEAVAEGADLAVFPEFAMYDTPELSRSFVDAAESLDGEFVTALVGLASKHRIAIVAGMHERGAGASLASNTLVAIDPDRGLVEIYRKQHLYDAFGYRESEFITPGPAGAPVVIEVGGVTVGLLTCYDLRFPEAAREVVDAGAEVILYPAAWMPGPRKEDHWKTLVRARAIENTAYVVAVSQGPPLVGVGGSLLVDPSGLVLGELGEADGVIIARIDRERLARVRSVNPCLANRRYAVVPDER